MKEVVQAGERYVRLELDAASREHAHRAGLLDRVVQDRGLADARLAADQQARALAQARGGESLVDRLQFYISA